MIKGTVKFFNNAKGFGFISPDDGGKDVFVPAATITQSGTPRLKAGQRVSFETEPDPKGPKAVRLTLLDEAPREVPRDMSKDASREAPREAKAAHAPRPAPLTLYHDPEDEEADEVLEALRDAGHEPRVVDVTLTPPARDELKRLSLLLRESDQSLVRRYDPLFHELQLDDRFISESEFWQGVTEHPQLINTPVLAAHGKAFLVREASDVRAFLGGPGEEKAKPKGLSARMAAMMAGHAVPPKPPEPKKPEKQPEPEKKAEKIVLPKRAAKVEIEAEPKAKKPAAVKAVAPKADKPEAKPVKKAVAKPAPKAVKKAPPAKKVAKKR